MKKHLIRFTATQRVHYDQTVEVTKKELAEWKNAVKAAEGGNERSLGELAAMWLNTWDVNDADDIDGDEVYVEFNPKPTKRKPT